MSSGALPQQIATANSGTVTSNVLDDKQFQYFHPNYKYVPVVPNTNGQAITLSSSINTIQTTLPNSCFNLAQSYMYFKINLPHHNVAGKYMWTFADQPFNGAISELSHFTGSGGQSMIADIPNLQNYLAIIYKKETALSEYMSNDARVGLYPSNSLNNVLPALRGGDFTSSKGAINPANLNYLEPAYFNVSAMDADVVLYVMCPLSVIKDSFFSINKMLTYQQISYINTNFGPLKNICYVSDSNTNPSAGTPLAYVPSSAATISDFQIFLATESDPNVIAKLVAECNAGYKYIVPWVQPNKIASLAATSQNFTVQVGQGLGMSLQKVIWAPFNTTENLDTIYDHSNLAVANGGYLGSKVQQYYTSLNSIRLQNLTLDTVTYFTDYMNVKRSLKGSVLQNRNIYQQNWFHLDDFQEVGADAEQDGSSLSVIAGIPMGQTGLTYTYNGVTVNAAYQYYIFMIFNRLLTVTPTLVTMI